ncbi:F-box protein At5g07610-like [Silene latifolia]|uniref:F-box protein At5g07610-like n=1 Tax=Silene latifolia TaxID=37657 RepID=UPI003D77AB88
MEEPTSGEKVAGSEDLTAEIFIRLPANSLALCKWVSKQWLSLITSPTFIKKHTLTYPPLLSGLFLIPRQPGQSHKIHSLSLNQTKPSFPFVDFLNYRGLEIIHACKGLLICYSQSEMTHYVCNPTTRQLRQLPSCPYLRNDEFALNLVFNPLRSPNYKVVCLQKVDGQESNYKIAIYSSETGVWSLSEEPFFVPDDVEFKDGVSCNNAIHWLKNTVSGLYLDLNNTEMLQEMPELPRRDEVEVSQYKFKYFGKSKDYLFYIISRPLLNYYEIYQMKEDYSGWDLKSRLNLNVLVTKYPSIARHFGFHPLFSEYECDVLSVVHSGDEDEDLEVVLSIPGEVVTFNLKKKTSTEMHDPVFRPSDVTIWYKTHSVYEYFETLSLV